MYWVINTVLKDIWASACVYCTITGSCCLLLIRPDLLAALRSIVRLWLIWSPSSENGKKNGKQHINTSSALALCMWASYPGGTKKKRQKKNEGDTDKSFNILPAWEIKEAGLIFLFVGMINCTGSHVRQQQREGVGAWSLMLCVISWSIAIGES